MASADSDGPIFVRLDSVYFQRCAARPITQERPVEVVPRAEERASKNTVHRLEERLVDVRLLADLWVRSSDRDVRKMGADLMQVLDGH